MEGFPGCAASQHRARGTHFKVADGARSTSPKTSGFVIACATSVESKSKRQILKPFELSSTSIQLQISPHWDELNTDELPRYIDLSRCTLGIAG